MNKTLEAQKQRAEIHLSKLIRYDGNVITQKQFMEALTAKGYIPQCKAVIKVAEATRNQMFRWDNNQQQDYGIKRAKGGTKMDYRMVSRDGSYHEVSKTCFDFACTISGLTEVKPERRMFAIFRIIRPLTGFQKQQDKQLFAAVYPLRDEAALRSWLSSDFPGAVILWFGEAGTEEEARAAAAL